MNRSPAIPQPPTAAAAPKESCGATRVKDGSKRELEQRFGSALNMAAIALVQFLVFCPIAMLVYPDEFSLVSDYLSFLGCFESLWTLHAWIFNVSLIGLGSGLFWMFWSLFRVTQHDPGELLICSVTGMLTAGSLVLVGLLPVNIFRDGHVFAMASRWSTTVTQPCRMGEKHTRMQKA